jgi:hypothetical protein
VTDRLVFGDQHGRPRQARAALSSCRTSCLGRSAQARHEAYRALFQAAPEPVVVEGIRQATNGGFVLGSLRFAQETRTRSGGGWNAASPGGRRVRQSRQRREGARPGAQKRGLSPVPYWICANT